MQNATTTVQSGEEATMPASVSGAEAAAVARELGTVSQAAPVVAPELAAMSKVEPKEVDQPIPVIEAAAEEASTPADGDGKSPSPAPVSPSKVTERQIPVDPVSLRRLGMVADEDSPISAPSVLTEVVMQSPLLPPLRRPTFVGASLPCSAVSSPVPSPRAAALSSLARQHSAAPPAARSRSASRTEGWTMAPHDYEDDEDPKALAAEDGSFMCGALCMLIPGFSKKKPAATAAGMAVLNMQRQQSSGTRPRRSSVSRVASLERFECGSWSPPPPPVASAAVTRESNNFNALEVPKISCADDTESPVKMAFVFDGEVPPTPGILKNSASSRLPSARPSASSQSHVKFSTAAASCPSSPSGVVTPRLARARAEFNAFLDAQSA
jgi:hypothetical protein